MVLRSRHAGFVLPVVVAVLGVGLGFVSPPRTSLAAARPNVVVFLLDDVSTDAIPHTPALMPKLQARLADPSDHWINFSNAFLNTPICCPTRSSLARRRRRPPPPRQPRVRQPRQHRRPASTSQ